MKADRSAPPHPIPLPAGEKGPRQLAPGSSAETIGTLRRQIARDLTAAFAARGYEGTPALDARLLVAHAVGIAPLAVPLSDDQAVETALAVCALGYAARRAAGEPVARIVGHKEFHGHDFILSDDTLVPRPETETLVDTALALVRADASSRIVDLGTGSGAILLSVLAERRRAVGLGIDIAPGAVRTAQENALRLGLKDRVLFAVGNWLAAVGQAAVILANPPYIKANAISRLDVDVREHDPIRALDGGVDGLMAIREIVTEAGRVLVRDGILLVEIGAGQKDQVAAIAQANGMKVRFERDLAGIDRVAVMCRC
jgi:release factor glutamine methyltransferase